MTDRELLELAAKAAGYKWRWFGDTFCTERDPQTGAHEPWNPLTDDGDAFRLAVKLGLTVSTRTKMYGTTARVWTYGIPQLAEPYGNDPAAATRRAIVRAAAEIARSAA